MYATGPTSNSLSFLEENDPGYKKPEQVDVPVGVFRCKPSSPTLVGRAQHFGMSRTAIFVVLCPDLLARAYSRPRTWTYQAQDFVYICVPLRSVHHLLRPALVLQCQMLCQTASLHSSQRSGSRR
jgi:hypothetical protein